MATGGFGVKDEVTWYMLGNTLLAEGGRYSLGEKKSWKKAPTMKTESTHTRGNTTVQ